MYGSIFGLKPKQGKKGALIDYFKQDQTIPEGGVAWFVMNPDDEGDLIGIAIFKDKESYRSNSERPEQHKIFLEMMEYLDGEPTWNDGTFIIDRIV